MDFAMPETAIGLFLMWGHRFAPAASSYRCDDGDDGMAHWGRGYARYGVS